MFNNSGKKIKIVAQFIFVIDVLFSIISAIILFANAEYGAIYILYGFISLIFGPVLAWISALLLYALGATVDNVQSIKNAQCNETTEDFSLWQIFSKKDAQGQTKKIEKLEEQLSSGKITFEDYNKAVDKDTAHN